MCVHTASWITSIVETKNITKRRKKRKQILYGNAVRQWTCNCKRRIYKFKLANGIFSLHRKMTKRHSTWLTLQLDCSVQRKFIFFIRLYLRTKIFMLHSHHYFFTFLQSILRTYEKIIIIFLFSIGNFYQLSFNALCNNFYYSTICIFIFLYGLYFIEYPFVTEIFGFRFVRGQWPVF